jgi:hypothetical protein
MSNIITTNKSINKQLLYYMEKLKIQKNKENFVHPKYICQCITVKCTGNCGCEEMPKEPPSKIPSIQRKIKKIITLKKN